MRGAGFFLDVIGGLKLFADLVGFDRPRPDRLGLLGQPPRLVCGDPLEGLLVGQLARR